MKKLDRYDARDEVERLFLEALLTGDVGRAIENQEARGQREFTHSSKLPIRIMGGTREQFEAMGIRYGDPLDDLFVAVTLPDGWVLKPTDHSMWNELVDNKGRKRASIFYKAAFYDRSAHMSIETRFSAHREPSCGWDSEDYRHGWEDWIAVVRDCGIKLWHSEIMKDEQGVDDVLRQQAQAWLDEHYPDWRNPLAYWD
jgi:hypothetical protein